MRRIPAPYGVAISRNLFFFVQTDHLVLSLLEYSLNHETSNKTSALSAIYVYECVCVIDIPFFLQNNDHGSLFPACALKAYLPVNNMPT